MDGRDFLKALSRQGLLMCYRVRRNAFSMWALFCLLFLAGSAMGSAVWSACTKECRILMEVCRIPHGTQVTLTREYGAPQGGYWWNNDIVDSMPRCKIGPPIPYVEYFGCTPVCVGNINNSAVNAAGGGVIFDVGFQTQYGCKGESDCM